MRLLPETEREFVDGYLAAFRRETGQHLILPTPFYDMLEENGVDLTNAAKPVLIPLTDRPTPAEI